MKCIDGRYIFPAACRGQLQLYENVIPAEAGIQYKKNVIPAEAGIQFLFYWFPAPAGTSLDSCFRRNDSLIKKSGLSLFLIESRKGRVYNFNENMAEQTLAFPFDPLERSAQAESLVMRGLRRVYHRFRPAPYYGGIATADAVGCSFLCAYCWNYNRNLYPQRFQDFYSPQQVASKLLNIARRKSFRLFRITGAEPILGERSFQHLVEVLNIIFQTRPDAVFILETNGFFLGQRVELVDQLPRRNLNIRVCLKGTDEDSFELITGAKKDSYPHPFLALKKLEEAGIRAWPALMRDLFLFEEIARLENLLDRHGIKAELELESLEAYPFVLENMKKRKVEIKNTL